MRRKIYLIVGPTAGGKSRFALQMAKERNGEIINADSMQIYQDLKVLSARPTDDEMAQVPHHLYGYLDSFSQNSVTDWLSLAVKQINACETPIVVGGTGLYVNALINGVSPIPDVPAEIRQTVRNMPLDEVRRMVQDCTATDPQRLYRALEVQLSTGKPLSYFYTLPRVKSLDADFEIFFINPPRAQLYEQCDRRFDNMIKNGAIEEVKHLIDMKACGGVLKAIGVPELLDFISGHKTYEEMVTAVKLATRHYAKRQVTWFKHQIAVDHEITIL